MPRDGSAAPLQITSTFDENAVGLPFNEDQQSALLGHALLKEGFFKVLQSRVKANWFGWPVLATIFKCYKSYYDEFGHVPRSLEEFETWRDYQALDQADRIKVKKAIVYCRTKTESFSLDHLQNQLTYWQKTQVFYRDLPQIANLLNSQKLADAEALLHRSAREIQVTRFEGAPPVDFMDWRGLREASEQDVKDALTTGLRVLDRHLLPEAGGAASLVKGDTTLIVAPTNAGKTSAMLTIARHNIVKGKDVLIITREGRDKDIAQKIFQSVLRKTRKEMWDWTRTPEGEAQMDLRAEFVASHVTYLHLPKVNLDVEEVISTILTLQAARRATHGKGYDLLVVDYPGIFQAGAARGARWEWRQIQDYIYRQFVQLGLEEGFHVLVAAQTNREGSKVNRGWGAKRLLTVEDISEAFAIAMSATNVLTLNRDVRAQAENRVTFYIVKSRSSETGWAVTARSDYGKCLTHHDELGAIAYRGEQTMNEAIDGLLKTYSNRDIPDSYVQKYGNSKMPVGTAT